MKTHNPYKSISFALLAGLFLQSCADKLDLKPISDTVVGEDGKGTSGSSIVSASTAEAALASCYNIFKNNSAEYYVMDYFLIGDARSDNAYAGADNPNVFEVDEFRLLSTNQMPSRDWKYLYNHITAANSIIANVPKVTDASFSDMRKKEIIAEAKFMRARAYFDLVRLFGDVPLIIDELPPVTNANLEEVYPLLYPKRNTVEEIYAQIISDLEAAGADAPNSGTTKFRATKGAVFTLLAKVHASQPVVDWSRVNSYCDQVIAQGYSLLPEYDQLWDGKHEHSSESIFELDFTDWASGGNWGAGMFYGTDWKKFNTPSGDLVKAFDDAGDEVRKNSTIFFASVIGKWSDPHWGAQLNRYPFMYKMRDTGGAQNIILFRLADVLLLKAEALNELSASGYTQAKPWVDQVRKRVKLNPTSASNQADMREAIATERRLELAFEGQRWYDLVRTNKAIEVMSQVKDVNGAALNYPISETKLLFPVPQEQLDLNTNLTQNPGY